MDALAAMSPVEARGLRALFTDIDGTLTDAEGRISADVFAAMERAGAADLPVVPITGRPAGWADLIARTWPIDGVVGENGGLYFRRERDAAGQDAMLRVFAQDEAERRRNRARLNALRGCFSYTYIRKAATQGAERGLASRAEKLSKGPPHRKWPQEQNS